MHKAAGVRGSRDSMAQQRVSFGVVIGRHHAPRGEDRLANGDVVCLDLGQVKNPYQRQVKVFASGRVARCDPGQIAKDHDIAASPLIQAICG